MKARIKWSKTGVLRFIGHLDVQRYFHKAMIRAELPVSFSQGMSPHQIMSFAAPLGIGMTSRGEYVDIDFDEEIPSREMMDRLNAVMNEGISVLEVKQVKDKERNCMSATAAADYLVSIDSTCYFPEVFLQRIMSFLMQENIYINKKTKRSEKVEDIAPMILEMKTFGDRIFMKLVTGSAANLKPQLVMEAYCNYLGYDYRQTGFRFERVETYLEDRGKLKPLGSVGWEIN